MTQHEILRIEKKRKGQYLIELNSYASFIVDQELIVQFNLHKGKLLTSLEVEQLIKDKERNKVYNTGLRLLGIRPRTSKEIRTKLKEKEFDNSWIDWTIGKLTNEGYINHQEYAMQFTEEAIRFKKKGVNWIRYELKKKGIEEEYINEALSLIDDSVEIESIRLIASKKMEQLVKKHEKYIALYKLNVYLQSRGYSNSLIKIILPEINDIN